MGCSGSWIFFFQAEDGIRYLTVTGVQTCALPICFVQRVEIGVSAQEITPALAAGLGLSREWGVVIADVIPSGPAAAAGLRSQDIIDAVDDRQVVGLPGLAAALYLHPTDENLKLEVLRGRQKLSVVVPAKRRKDEGYDLADFIDPRNLIDGLGVFMVDLDDRLRSPLHTRNSSGVVVIARSPGLSTYKSDFVP